MKSKNKISKVYNLAKGENTYYSLDDFIKDAKSFFKDVKNKNTVCSMKVSQSGMTRRFNFKKYNMLLNICYNKKFSWDSVKVEGYGMDMHWHLKFLTCQELFTKGECEKYNLNYSCSSGTIL